MEASTSAGFPYYPDGDVIIFVGPSKKYQLHASVLRRNSPHFEHLLSPQNATQLSARARKEGVTIQYHMEWLRSGADAPADVGTFQLKDLDTWGRPTGALSYNFLDNDNGKVPPREYMHWEFLFGIFYNIPPKVYDDNIAHTLQDCLGIVEVAASVQAVSVVREPVDLALLRYGPVLWNSIAKTPAIWAYLSYHTHSPDIFKESIIHLVGKWRMLSQQEIGTLPSEVTTLCEKKHNELDIIREAIEMRLLGHYPQSMTRAVADRPGRGAYSNDIYLWMSLCFFRHWFAQAINDGRTRMAADGGYGFYKKIAQGGRSYLDHEDFRNFHQYFPMSSKACNILETNMNEIKEDMRHFVTDLLQNSSVADPNTCNFQWLTCISVKKEDFPWENNEENANANANADANIDPQITDPQPNFQSTAQASSQSTPQTQSRFSSQFNNQVNTEASPRVQPRASSQVPSQSHSQASYSPYVPAPQFGQQFQPPLNPYHHDPTYPFQDQSARYPPLPQNLFNGEEDDEPLFFP